MKGIAMTAGVLEHVNMTVKDPKATAALLCDLFGWHVRWQGPAIAGGFTVHVGSDDSFVAVYSGATGKQGAPQDNYSQLGGLNHIGVVVDDLDAVEARVAAAGLKAHSHADYEPGRRFYFHDRDGIEFEVVSYA
jgi:catechol 2,3-dioxygenase-like lactoylglutathione lyase family enzyme